MRRPLLMSAVLLVSLGSIVAVAAPTAASAPARAAASGTAVDWQTYHGDRARSGYQSGSTRYAGGLHVVKSIKLDGAVYASPIVVHGTTIVATENDTVYAFNASNQLLWKRHLGTPVPLSKLPCGDIDPLGITGTPTYTWTTNLVYVAAEMNPSAPSHQLFALRPADGSIAFQRSLDLPGVQASAMQERGALTTAKGRVWVPFGGLAGDCAAYKGRVVGYSVNGTGSPISFTVPTTREAGIWTPPGPSVGGQENLNVSVGNGASGVGDPYDYSDSVLRISAKNAKLLDSFSPSTWPTDNDHDLDLGSQGPALVGDSWVFAAGKSGTAYVLHANALGGIGGQVSQATLCQSFGGTAVVDDRVFVPCTDGVRAVRIDDTGHLHVLWHAASSITGSPVLTLGMVWTLDTANGVLYGLGSAHGIQQASIAVGPVSRFATPALSSRRILIGTLSGLTVLAY